MVSELKGTFKRRRLLVPVDDGHLYVTQGPPQKLKSSFYLAQTAVRTLVGPTSSKKVTITVTATDLSRI